MTYILATPGNAALRTGRTSDPGRPYLVTTVALNRRPLFEEFQDACAMARQLAASSTWAGADLCAWVLMPDHMHAIVVPVDLPLSVLVARAKGRTSFEFNRYAGRRGPVWQRGFHDRAIRRNEDIRDTVRYIVANPVRAGIAATIGDYPFWGCAWADVYDWLS